MQIVLLAAGESRRMGKNKLALLYKEKPLLIHSLEAALSSSDHVVLVTGYYQREVAQLVEQYHYLHHPNLQIVHNPQSHLGQFSSTLVGFKYIDDNQSCAISLADSPLIEAKHYFFLQENLGSFDGVRVFYKGTPGHPMLCSASLVKEARKEKVDSSMRSFLVGKNINTIESDDPKWVTDVDTREAYASLLSL